MVGVCVRTRACTRVHASLHGSNLPMQKAPSSLLSGPRAFSELTVEDVCKVATPPSRDNTFLRVTEKLLPGKKGGVPVIYQKVVLLITNGRDKWPSFVVREALPDTFYRKGH